MKITTLSAPSHWLWHPFLTHLHITSFALQLSGIFHQDMESISPVLAPGLAWRFDLAKQMWREGWYVSSKPRSREALHNYTLSLGTLPPSMNKPRPASWQMRDHVGQRWLTPATAVLDQPLLGWPTGWLQTPEQTHPRWAEPSPDQQNCPADL